MMSGSVEMQDTNTIASSSAVTLDSPPLSLAARLEPIYKSDEDSSPPLAKHSKHAHYNQIMAPPTDHWDIEDLISIYGSGAENNNDGFAQMCSSVFCSLIDPYTYSGSKKCPNVCMFSTKGDSPQHPLTRALT